MKTDLPPLAGLIAKADHYPYLLRWKDTNVAVSVVERPRDDGAKRLARNVWVNAIGNPLYCSKRFQSLA
jgi:hypothetical protein